MLLFVDNHDSFTFNLVQLFAGLGAEVKVMQGDALTLEAVRALAPERIVVGPGPGSPEGLSVEIFSALSGALPLLGVCLGHQALARAFGAEVIRGRRPVHGKASALRHDGAGLFSGEEQSLRIGRYHSLTVDESTLPDELVACAHSEDDGAVQALRHRSHPTFGLQFHPESILTPRGPAILARFLAA